MWIVIRHPDLTGAALAADHAVDAQVARGWVPCSPPLPDRYAIDVDNYPMPPVAPEPEPVKAERPAAASVKPTARKEANK